MIRAYLGLALLAGSFGAGWLGHMRWADVDRLKAEIAAGRFREDLYHRLSVIVIEVPPLNERRDDIPLLVEHFLGQLDGAAKKVSPEAMAYLQQMDWSGNVRQLRNVVERLHILGGNPISGSDAERYA